ncbi:MAG TPA: hypothetical protein VLE49_13580, partial [Anaerolineales bacterium]|nr:hypothetical protein [Anaerolineales bacterium]
MPLIVARLRRCFLLTCLLTGCIGTGVESATAPSVPSRTALPTPLPATATKAVLSALATSTPSAVVAIPTALNPPGSRGAAVPWIEYEAEDAQTNGEILLPDRTFGTMAAESSGRRAVKLEQAGEYVQFRSMGPANSVVVRFVIPD